MNKIIIGIHGLSNKPTKVVLASYWKRSLKEGLKNVGYSGKIPFESVHWADLLYKYPLHEDRWFNFDSLFNEEPYVAAQAGALRKYSDSWVDDLRAGSLSLVGSSLDAMKRYFGMNKLADWVIQKWLRDLAFYYDRGRCLQGRNKKFGQASEVLQGELLTALRNNKGKKIMLIAHSMGSIIAYDTLRNIGQSEAEEDTDLVVPYFVTIGSPLGLPYVKGKIIEERKYAGRKRAARVRTPSIVTKSWINYSDRKDLVTVDMHLRDDYRKNKSEVRVVDDLVVNDYQAPNGEHNHHKSYGYLRTPELSCHVKAFLK